MDKTSTDISEYLKCVKCKKYLKPPIFQCSQGHATCNECNVNQKECPQCGHHYSPVLRMIGQIAKTVNFPCVFQANGCEKKINWKALENHEADCNFRNHSCPEKECSWNGPNNKLQEHFLDKHKQLALIAPSNAVQFQVDLSTSYHKILLVGALKCNFLLHLIRENETSFISVILQFVGRRKDSERYFFELEILTFDEKPSFKIESPVDSNYSNISETTRKVGLFDYLFKNTNNQCKLRIRKRLLECPICLDTMSSPIFICYNGHSLCGECKNKLTDCPSCKVRLGYTRNYALETVLTEPPDPDYFDAIPEGINFQEIKRSNCECPFESVEDCSWRGPLAEVIPHAREHHSWRLVSNGDNIKLYEYNNVLIDFSGKPFIYEEITRGNFTYATVQTYMNSQCFRYIAEFKDGCVYSGRCTDRFLSLEQLIDCGSVGMARRMATEEDLVVKVTIEAIGVDAVQSSNSET